MKLKTIFIINLAMLPSLFTIRSASAQPKIELPPEEPRQAIPRPPLLQLQRESQIEVPLYEAPPAGSSTAIGGYGELTFNAPSNAPNVVDMRRIVLYIGHNFTDKLRFYGELELEHAVTSAEDAGEFELEQAFLDYLAWKRLNFRAGVILVPMGIINIYHEPPTFNGVDRPETDVVIIPSTWREPGAGIFGDYRGLRYQAYAINGFKANGFTASNGVREGHQEAALAFGHDWGVIARLDYGLPFLYKHRISADAGVSFYYSHADQGQPMFRGVDGDSVPVTMLEADLRLRSRGLEFRGEIATAWIGGIHRLNRALAEAAAAEMTEFEGPVAHQLIGGYVELGYNVLHPFKLRSGLSLVPFMRYEHTDTQYRLPADLDRAAGNLHDILTAGLTFRPIAEVAVKFDYQRIWTDATESENQKVDRFNLGLAFMF